MEVKAQGCERTPGIGAGDMIVMIAATRPVAIEARESTVGWQILGATESLTPSSQEVILETELRQVLW